MRKLATLIVVVVSSFGCHEPSPPASEPLDVIADDYVDGWATFYPTRALTAGQATAALRFEDFTQSTIDAWVVFNRKILARVEELPDPPTLDERIDRRLVENQIERELYRWEELEAHRTDPPAYSNLINHSLTPILVRQNLSQDDRALAVSQRLTALLALCETATAKLEAGRPVATLSAIRDVRATASFFEEQLLTALDLALEPSEIANLGQLVDETANELNALAQWMEESTPAPVDDAYGEARYARELALAYGDHMTPAVLEELALEEIETVRAFMEELARSTWTETRNEPAPADFDRLIGPLLAEMETLNSGDQASFLQEFLDLIDRSREFLEDHDLVDLPENETLFTALSPSHFAGAAVGGVYSAGPFDPDAETLFYLPTVPDTAPEAARDGFYRSFNTPFNTMIITHEIYPGHYLQLKAAANHPSPLRSLFAGDDFTEGWASFCEQMTLDAGWDEDRPLTRMAHLRKRLENAVRAYVSVQVHCRGWSRVELHDFAVETGLLPPQFAENLWHRAMLSPIQLPSYFIGFRVFDDAYHRERDRLGDDFDLKAFNNAVLASGGIPMDMLAEYLEAARSGPENWSPDPPR